jgi:hypothetical protein
MSALILVPSYHHDRLVLIVVHIGERRVALYEHAGIKRHTQLTAQVGHSFGFVFAAAIG